jgi:two-component system, NtrC family, nitrogen regulation sensor histidine kinase NtrY
MLPRRSGSAVALSTDGSSVTACESFIIPEGIPANASVNKVLRKPKLFFETRIFLLALAGAIPALLVSLIILWTQDYSPKVRWTLTALMLAFWWGFAGAVRERVASPLRTLANLLEAIREGDYSVRLRGASYEDALGEVMQQVNAMSSTLRAQRLGALEATTLLRKVMEEIDVAVFAFDAAQLVRLVNRGGERLLGQGANALLGKSAEALGLQECLEGEPSQILRRSFPGAPNHARWGLTRTAFREGGLPHNLVVLTDLTRPLREEELLAWQRLVRVLGHELNNSLTPIKSIAGSLEKLVTRDPLPEDWQEDARRGLSVIASRSEALSRFMAAYARLARLPRPRFASVNVAAWISDVARLETRVQLAIQAGPELTVQGDRDQLEQALINVVRNAVDASLETGGRVSVGWTSEALHLVVWVRDEGHGLSNTANLFVPFFTTKPGGSGIGLVLSRQIAEAHGGTLVLENRNDRQGCEARLTLPL